MVFNKFEYIYIFTLAILTLALSPHLAHAYVGPGAGLTAIGSFIALVLAVIVAIFGFLWYPIKRIMNKRKAKAQSTE